MMIQPFDADDSQDKNIRATPAEPDPDPTAVETAHTSPASPASGKYPAPEEWKNGDILLDDYRVIRMLGRGGMGCVYLVETVTPPRLKYAVKILAKRLLTEEKMKRLFLRELQTWIDLQSHPNIISCRFFKTIEGRLAIFSEFAEADSLKTWIRNGKTDSMNWILDIAIQSAWGLEAAHRQGVIHLDMKPDNILMTQDGTAKITDFGISMLLPLFPAGKDTGLKPGQNTLARKEHVSGMTPAYASPEQFNGESVTLQSDIWSWGVSILEMFTGPASWKFGFLAGDILEDCFRNPLSSGRTEIPENLYRVLKRCFADVPEKRWFSMGDIAGELQHLWNRFFRQPYPRLKPVVFDRKDGSPTGSVYAASLTHWQTAAQWLETGLTAAGISVSDYTGPVPVVKNTREAQAVNDLEIMDAVLKLIQHVPGRKRASVLPFIPRLHSDKAAVHEFLGDFTGALENWQHALAAYDILFQQSGNTLLKKDYAGATGNLANLYYLMGDYDKSIESQQQAIRNLDEIIDDTSPADWINMQARLYYNLAVTSFGMKKKETAVENALKCVRIRENLVFEKHRLEFIENLVQSYSNTASIYMVSDQNNKALEFFDKAMTLIRRSSVDSISATYARHIASISQGKAMTLRQMKDYSRALAMFDAAGKILTALADQSDSMHDLQQLSINDINRGNMLRDIGRYDEAEHSYASGIDRMRMIINDRGCREFSVFLAKAALNRGRLCICTGDAAGIRENLALSLNIYLSLILEKKKPEILREFSTGLTRCHRHLIESERDPETVYHSVMSEEHETVTTIDHDTRHLYDRFEQFLITEQMADFLEIFRSVRQLLGVY